MNVHACVSHNELRPPVTMRHRSLQGHNNSSYVLKSNFLYLTKIKHENQSDALSLSFVDNPNSFFPEIESPVFTEKKHGGIIQV